MFAPSDLPRAAGKSWLPTALFAVLLLLAIVPIWTLPIFPTQDGPSHVYAARALMGVLDGSPPYPLYYEAVLTPVPNWLGGVALAGLGALMPLRVAERLLLTISIILFSFGFRLLTAEVGRAEVGRAEVGRAKSGRHTPPAALLGPAFAYGITLHYGFHSYGLGLALVPWAWSLSTRVSAKARVATALLGALAWLCHLVPALLIVLGLVVSGATSAVRARARRHLLSALAAALPAGALCATWIVQSPPGETTHWPLSTLAESLVSLRSLASYVGPAEHAAMVVGAVTLALALFGRPSWRQEPWPWLALACTAAYVVLPDGGSDFWFLSDRLGLYPWLALAPLAGRAQGRLALALAALATATLLGIDTYESSRLQPALAEVDALATRVPARATVMTLDFSPVNAPARFRPWLHLSGYGAARNGAVDASSHEPQTTHFQLRLRPNVGFPDASRLVGRAGELDFRRLSRTVRFVIAVGADEAQETRLRQGYRRVDTQGQSALWQASP
jgi:hypothetical protein